MTVARGRLFEAAPEREAFRAAICRRMMADCPAVHTIRAMASSAASVNQARLVWPWGTMMKAASSGPSEPPA